MKTCIKIGISTEGAKVSEIAEKLSTLGFIPVLGKYNFEFKWAGKVTESDIRQLEEKVHKLLEGTGATVKFKTVGD